MPVTHEQIALIRWSFDKLRPRLQPASTEFYERLFALKPEFREMFRSDDIAGQGMKFMSTMETVLDTLGPTEPTSARVEELGQHHRRLGVTAGMFAPMEEALIATLRHALDDDLGADVEAAWRAAYRDLAEAMIARGAIPPT